MLPAVTLRPVEPGDVKRLAAWLSDPEVCSSWYGLGVDGLPVHPGYSPHKLLQAPEQEWQQVFQDQDRQILAVYSPEAEHVGEGQLVIERSLSEAQLLIIIGRKDVWHHHYGTAAVMKLLDQAFDALGLHRVWVDVPEYNHRALEMCRHVGFVLEGHLRKTHRKDGAWYDSSVMGLLVDEYSRRRARLLGPPAEKTP